MSNENEKCPLKKESFKNFLVVAIGAFVGVFCALVLYSALNKPYSNPYHYRSSINSPCPYHNKIVENQNNSKEIKTDNTKYKQLLNDMKERLDEYEDIIDEELEKLKK